MCALSNLVTRLPVVVTSGSPANAVLGNYQVLLISGVLLTFGYLGHNIQTHPQTLRKMRVSAGACQAGRMKLRHAVACRAVLCCTMAVTLSRQATCLVKMC